MFSTLISTNRATETVFGSNNAHDLDSLIRMNLSFLANFKKYFPIQKAFIQGAFTSDRLKTHYRELMDSLGQIIHSEIIEIFKKNHAPGIDTFTMTRILQVTTSFSYMLYLEGILQSSDYEFTTNLGIFLYYLFNFSRPEYSCNVK